MLLLLISILPRIASLVFGPNVIVSPQDRSTLSSRLTMCSSCCQTRYELASLPSKRGSSSELFVRDNPVGHQSYSTYMHSELSKPVKQICIVVTTLVVFLRSCNLAFRSNSPRRHRCLIQGFELGVVMRKQLLQYGPP